MALGRQARAEALRVMLKQQLSERQPLGGWLLIAWSTLGASDQGNPSPRRRSRLRWPSVQRPGMRGMTATGFEVKQEAALATAEVLPCHVAGQNLLRQRSEGSNNIGEPYMRRFGG